MLKKNHDKYLICIGVQKAGTTLLYDLLKKHNQLNVGKVKELHYFNRVKNPLIEEYNKLFVRAKGIKFDVTPCYIFYQNTLEKIASVLKKNEIKIIIILRNPIKRAQSHYNMSLKEGKESQEFEKTFYLEEKRILKSDIEYNWNSYFSRGIYYDQIKKCYKLFGKNNVKIIIFEKYVKDQQKYVDEICDFVGIDKITITPLRSGEGYIPRNKLLNYIIKKYALYIRKIIPKSIMDELSEWYFKVNLKNTEEIALSQEFLANLADYYNKDIEKVEKLLEKKLGYKINI